MVVDPLTGISLPPYATGANAELRHILDHYSQDELEVAGKAGGAEQLRRNLRIRQVRHGADGGRRVASRATRSCEAGGRW